MSLQNKISSSQKRSQELHGAQTKVRPYAPFRNNVRVLFTLETIMLWEKITYAYGTRTVKMQLHFVELANAETM